MSSYYCVAGSSDDGGGGDTDAGRSDDERSLSSEASSGRSSVHSNNNNRKKDAVALDESGGNAVAGGDSVGLNSFSFFELPGNAAALPYNLEVRNTGSGGVWTKTQLPKGVKYGPFLGKWGPKPVDSRFAWEVREKKRIENSLCICY